MSEAKQTESRMDPAMALSSGETQLAVEGLHLSFGGVTALSGVSLEARQSEILAIIGPNGAGKTSMLNSVSGLYRPQKGSITFYDGGQHDILGLRPDEIAYLGIARSFQNIELFRHMSVLDNLLLGRHIHMKGNVLSGGVYWGLAQKEEMNTTILLVEQNAHLALEIADYAFIMESGRIVLEGTPEELHGNADVREFYLGLTEIGKRKSYRDVKHYKRRKRWLS